MMSTWTPSLGVQDVIRPKEGKCSKETVEWVCNA